MRVRPATTNDAEAIARVHVLAWQQGYAGLIPDEVLAGLSVLERTVRWRELLADEAVQVHVAEQTEGVVGFLSVGPGRDEDLPAQTTELYALYVDPAHWGTEVADLLMTRAGQSFALWVLADNPRARRFYARHGWQPDGASKQESMAGVELAAVRYRR
jgi:GNAT superfamily N-acetyltransferase